MGTVGHLMEVAMPLGQGFAGRIASIAEAEGVRYTIEDGLIHLEEEDLRIRSFRAKGNIKGISFDYSFPEHRTRIDRLYLQSLVELGTKELSLPQERREELLGFYGHRLLFALNGENMLLELVIMGLDSVLIEWK